MEIRIEISRGRDWVGFSREHVSSISDDAMVGCIEQMARPRTKYRGFIDDRLVCECEIIRGVTETTRYPVIQTQAAE